MPFLTMITNTVKLSTAAIMLGYPMEIVHLLLQEEQRAQEQKRKPDSVLQVIFADPIGMVAISEQSAIQD